MPMFACYYTTTDPLITLVVVPHFLVVGTLVSLVVGTASLMEILQACKVHLDSLVVVYLYLLILVPGLPGAFSPPGPSNPQGPPGLSFIQPATSTLDQNIADINRAVMQLLAARQDGNVQMQVQVQQSTAVQMVHADALRILVESNQQRSFDHIFQAFQYLTKSKSRSFCSESKG